MEQLIAQLYHCTVTQFDTWDGDQPVFEAVQNGVLIRADSLALFLSALAEPVDVRLAA